VLSSSLNLALQLGLLPLQGISVFSANSVLRSPRPLPAKPHGIILFADHHPLTPLESYRFKNTLRKECSRRSRSPKSFPCHRSKNSPVSPAIATDPRTALSNPCVCHTSETPGGYSQALRRLLNLSPLFSNSCALFCAVLQKSETQLLFFHGLPHSFTKTRGCGVLPSRLGSHSTLSQHQRPHYRILSIGPRTDPCAAA